MAVVTPYLQVPALMPLAKRVDLDDLIGPLPRRSALDAAAHGPASGVRLEGRELLRAARPRKRNLSSRRADGPTSITRAGTTK